MRLPRVFAPQRAVALLAAAVASLAILLAPTSAEARGSITVHNPTVKEDEGRWKLKITINYGSKPHLAHMPMVFSFKPTAIYQRILTEQYPNKKRPQRITKRLQNQTPKVVEMDVGFGDMRGEIHKITKFKLPLSRKNDFVAGEYELTVKLASGGTMGRKIRLRLQGDNKIIDRRPIEFKAGPVKPKKAKPAPAMEADNKGPRAAEDMGPDLSDIPDVPDDEPVEKPPAVEKKSGGCAIAEGAVGRRGGSAGWLGLLALMLLPVVRRE